MKLFDLKVVQVGSDGKNHWFTIGRVFAADDGRLSKTEIQRGPDGDQEISKPVGFVLNWPPAQGIIVPTPDRKEKEEVPI